MGMKMITKKWKVCNYYDKDNDNNSKADKEYNDDKDYIDYDNDNIC